MAEFTLLSETQLKTHEEWLFGPGVVGHPTILVCSRICYLLSWDQPSKAVVVLPMECEQELRHDDTIQTMNIAPKFNINFYAVKCTYMYMYEFIIAWY